jgi:hypothetical protein
MARPRLPKPKYNSMSKLAGNGVFKQTRPRHHRVGPMIRIRYKNTVNVEQTKPIARVAKILDSKKQTVVTTTPKKPISRYQNGLLNLTRTRKYLLDKYEGLPFYIQGLTRY